MTDYFVDATLGNDGAAGTSELAPWQTIDPKVNGEAYSPADNIALKRAESWAGQRLLMPSAGSAGSPITVTDYGLGALPIVDAIHTISSWTEVPGATSTIWDAEEQTGDNTWSDFTRGAVCNYRAYIKNASITADATTIRVTFKGNSANAQTLINAAIGLKKAAADPYDFDEAPTNITFGSGNEGGEVAAGGTLVSDWITYTIDNTKDHLVAWYYDDQCHIAQVQAAAGEEEAFKAGVADETDTQDVAGYTEHRNIQGLSLIEKQTASEWYASLTTAPATVFEDNDLMTEGVEGSLAVGEWAYNAVTDRLYVRLSDDDDPSGHTINWCLENASIDTNSKDWITVENLRLGVPYVGAVNRGYGFSSDTASENIGVRDLTIVGVLEPGDIDDHVTTGIQCRNGPITLTGNDISHVTRGMRIYPDTGAGFSGLIDDNIIYDLDKGEQQESDCITVTGAATDDMDGLVISNNDLSLFLENGFDIMCPNVVIESNHIYNPHADAIDVMSAMKIWEGANGTIIRYNLIEDMIDSLAADGAGIIIQSVDDCEVYYNIVDSCRKSPIIAYDTNAAITGLEVYNNTLVNTPERALKFMATGGNGITATAHNNICEGAVADIRVDGVTCVVTGGYNCLMNDAAATETNGGTYNGGANDLGSTDPLFANEAIGDFSLQSGSPCINAGVDVGLTQDYAGITVPQGAAPDMGILEYFGRGEKLRFFLI